MLKLSEMTRSLNVAKLNDELIKPKWLNDRLEIINNSCTNLPQALITNG
jgi:hypothetical protein